METAKGIQNSNARKIYWAHFFLEDPHCAIRSTSILYTVMVEKDVTSVLEEYSDDWEYWYQYAKDYDVSCHFWT